MHNDYTIGPIKPIKIAGVIFLSIASLFLLAKTVTSVRGWSGAGTSVTEKPQITVNGSGEVFAVPTTATFSFTVMESAANVKDAQAKATDRTNKAIDYLKKQNIDEKDIKTIAYNINPKYEFQDVVCVRAPCPARQTLTGYETSQTIEVKVRDTTKSGDLLSGIGSLGVQNVSGLNFTLDTDAQMEVARQARQKAITDAKNKAQVLAKDLGVSLVRIVSFQESGQPMYYAKESLQSANAVDMAAPAPQIPVGENKITSNVSITYEIR